MITDELEFDWNEDRTRFGARPAGEGPAAAPVAFAEVRWNGDILEVLHTETEPTHQGKGLAGRLTRALLDQARTQGWHVVPRCHYTAGWIGRHPDYADLVVGDS